MRTAPARIAVIAVVAPLAFLARLPSVDSRTADELAHRFHFTQRIIPPPAMPAGGIVYSINPSAAHLKTYLHSIGASVVLGDVDGDGLPNDLCATDIRTKALVIEPVPDTGARYAPFELDLGLPEKRAASWPFECRLADLNEDGLMDVVVSSMERTPQLFLRKDTGSPHSALSADSFVRIELDPKGRISYIPTINLTDVDGDGHVDLVIGAYLPDGIRVFDADATEHVVLQDGFSRARNGGEDRIFLWAGATSGEHPDVRYREAHDAYPTDTAFGWTLAMASADIDLDGLSDLFIANDFGTDTLLLNRSTPGHVHLIELKGRKSFFIPESKVMGYDSYKSMGADVADINDDGLPDFYVSNIGTNFGLHEGHQVWLSDGRLTGLASGTAPYRDVGEDLGVSQSAWSWESRFDDFDNDGVMELVQATGFFKGTINKWAEIGQLGLINPALIHDPAVWPAITPETDIDGSAPEPFWVRTSTGRYADLSTRLFPHLTANARAIATADVDGDGDLDMAFGNQWEDSLFFRNDAPAPGRSLGLDVLLPIAGAPPGVTTTHPGVPRWREGTPAVGARVTVHRSDGRALVRQVDLSNGHVGARAPGLLFGLGDEPSSAIKTDFVWRDHEGRLHEQVLTLSPGRHTVVLAAAAGAPT